MNKHPSAATLMWRNMKMRHTQPRANRRQHQPPGKIAQEILSARRRKEAA